MIPHVNQKESLNHALRRACQAHATRALAVLRGRNLPSAVHEARKEIKRLRALFRLARSLHGRKEHREAARLLRLAPKSLAASRDARVRYRAFETLGKSTAGQFPEVRSCFQAAALQAEQQLKDFDAAAVSEYFLEQVCDRLGHLSRTHLGWPQMRRHLEKNYERGRTAYRRAFKQPSPESFHQWRKRVKDLWYQLDFLCPAWPPATNALLEGLEQLGVQLGDDHDLVLLHRFTREHFAAAVEAAGIQKLIGTRRKQYGERIRRLGARLYGPAPGAVASQLEQDWQAWRHS
jgi:CHAD domain-containing protein